MIEADDSKISELLKSMENAKSTDETFGQVVLAIRNRDFRRAIQLESVLFLRAA